jgi:cytokinin trans-hydroxylase
MSWMLLHLLMRPDLLRRVVEEVDQVYDELGDHVTSEHLARLVLTENVMKETLRITPPVEANGRMALEDEEIDGALGRGAARASPLTAARPAGIFFPKGTVVTNTFYGVQTDERVWGPNAFDFDADRWAAITPEQQASFMPFSLGPRIWFARARAGPAHACG